MNLNAPPAAPAPMPTSQPSRAHGILYTSRKSPHLIVLAASITVGRPVGVGPPPAGRVSGFDHVAMLSVAVLLLCGGGGGGAAAAESSDAAVAGFRESRLIVWALVIIDAQR